MHKTSDQIYDEVEARNAESKAQSRSKWRSRIAQTFFYCIFGFAILVWPLARKDGAVDGFSVAILLMGLVPQYFKSWDLEDKIEQLEKQLEEKK